MFREKTSRDTTLRGDIMEKQAFKRKPVESSNIVSIGHSFPRRMLEVEFKNGSVYRYKGVNNRIYRAILSSDSKGKALHNLVKGKYPYKKIVDKSENNIKEANIVNYEEIVKEAYEEIVGLEKEAITIDGNRIYLDKEDYFVRDATKGEEILAGAKNVGKKMGKFMKSHPRKLARIAAPVAIVGGGYAYDKIHDKRKKQQTEKAAFDNYDDMVKAAYQEIIGFNKEAWSMADDPNLAAILDSAQKAESKNTSAQKVEVPKINVPNDIALAVRKSAENGGSHKLPKNFKRYGTIGAAALAGTLALGATAKAVRDKKKRKNQETAENINKK